MRIYAISISDSAELLEPVVESKTMRALQENVTKPYFDWQVLALQKLVIEQKK